MNTGDVIQIDAPDFDPDIDEGLPTQEHQEAQGSASITQQSFKKSEECKAPALLQRDVEEVDWPDTIPVKIPPQQDQDIEQNIPVVPTRCETNHNEIPQLESDLDKEEEQFEDLQTYLTHHNTYQESQNICKEYRKRSLDLDDDTYYWKIDHAYEYLRLNLRPHTSQPSSWTLPYDTGAYTNIRQRKRAGPQGKAPWAPTLWSMNTISAEQNTMQDQENSMHATEICEYTITFCTTI